MDKSRCGQCICHDMEQLLDEQQKLNFEGFRFICDKFGYDTIPFILSNGKCSFETFGVTMYGKFFTTQVFRLENLDPSHCCATLSLLVPVDMDGCPVELCNDVYSLLKTDNCMIVDLTCFCTIQPLSPKLVNRELPIIEPKC
ncbi:CotY/CotZ family spore coat protein [Neobacillus drentensis]|uniref:CotY/CotZ family spore coat protein n=1 Tax=Neobacillus drentensis TaxID=220684 RepID=UPI002FFFBA0E